MLKENLAEILSVNPSVNPSDLNDFRFFSFFSAFALFFISDILSLFILVKLQAYKMSFFRPNLHEIYRNSAKFKKLWWKWHEDTIFSGNLWNLKICWILIEYSTFLQNSFSWSSLRSSPMSIPAQVSNPVTAVDLLCALQTEVPPLAKLGSRFSFSRAG